MTLLIAWCVLLISSLMWGWMILNLSDSELTFSNLRGRLLVAFFGSLGLALLTVLGFLVFKTVLSLL
jgi:hypothetical protein